jgi:hypothetical protein
MPDPNDRAEESEPVGPVMSRRQAVRWGALGTVGLAYDIEAMEFELEVVPGASFLISGRYKD